MKMAAYENGKWSKPAAPQHDYMGFSAQAVSVFFDLDGAHLWFGTFDGQAARLARVRLGVGKPQNVELPQFGRDAVAYIAQNPAQRNEYAVATFERSVYVSKDAGRTWAPIAVRGNGK